MAYRRDNYDLGYNLPHPLSPNQNEDFPNLSNPFKFATETIKRIMESKYVLHHYYCSFFVYFDLIITKLISNYIKLNLLYVRTEDKEPKLGQHKAASW